ncbi:MAG: DUF427 domain-containing protein [Pseudonocardiales bacterium]
MVQTGRESVWDYPRPPRAARVRRRVRIVHGGTLVLDTDDVVRVLETSHPPSYYLPRAEFRVPLHRGASHTYPMTTFYVGSPAPLPRKNGNGGE